jgi:hypothetical protein
MTIYLIVTVTFVFAWVFGAIVGYVFGVHDERGSASRKFLDAMKEELEKRIE